MQRLWLASRAEHLTLDKEPRAVMLGGAQSLSVLRQKIVSAGSCSVGAIVASDLGRALDGYACRAVSCPNPIRRESRDVPYARGAPHNRETQAS